MNHIAALVAGLLLTVFGTSSTWASVGASTVLSQLAKEDGIENMIGRVVEEVKRVEKYSTQVSARFNAWMSGKGATSFKDLNTLANINERMLSSVTSEEFPDRYQAAATIEGRANYIKTYTQGLASDGLSETKRMMMATTMAQAMVAKGDTDEKLLSSDPAELKEAVTSRLSSLSEKTEEMLWTAGRMSDPRYGFEQAMVNTFNKTRPDLVDHEGNKITEYSQLKGFIEYIATNGGEFSKQEQLSLLTSYNHLHKGFSKMIGSGKELDSSQCTAQIHLNALRRFISMHSATGIYSHDPSAPR